MIKYTILSLGPHDFELRINKWLQDNEILSKQVINIEKRDHGYITDTFTIYWRTE